MWPNGAYEFVPGAWYVPYKGAQGGPFTTPQEAHAWMQAVDMRDANLANPTYVVNGAGTIPIRVALADPSLCEWLRYRQMPYRWTTGRDLWFDVFDGQMADINRAKQMGDLGNPGMTFRPAPADNTAGFAVAREADRLEQEHGK